MTDAREHALYTSQVIIPNAFQKLRHRRDQVAVAVVPRKDACPKFNDALHVAAAQRPRVERWPARLILLSDDPQVQGCCEAPGP